MIVTTFAPNHTTTFLPITVPDDLIGKDIKEVRISLSSLPTGADFQVDVVDSYAKHTQLVGD